MDLLRGDNFTALTGVMIIRLKRVIKGNERESIYD